VDVPPPKKGAITKLFAGAAVPATVPKADDPLQSKVFMPRNVLPFPNVRNSVLEETGTLIAFVIFAILLKTLYLMFLLTLRGRFY
jgi:hypothetical protein